MCGLLLQSELLRVAFVIAEGCLMDWPGSPKASATQLKALLLARSLAPSFPHTRALGFLVVSRILGFAVDTSCNRRCCKGARFTTC